VVKGNEEMRLLIKKKIERILHLKNPNKKMCLVCGEMQTHSLIYCTKCGEKLKYKYKNYLDYFIRAKNRLIKRSIIMDLKWFYYVHSDSPFLEKIMESQFLFYMENKYNLKQEDF